MPAELHIGSCVVRARPEAVGDVRGALAGLPGVEFHAAGPTGKMVLTLETESEGGIVRHLAALRDLPGVLSADLVFHRVLPPPTSSGD
jgi:nitrate reductase NapD